MNLNNTKDEASGSGQVLPKEDNPINDPDFLEWLKENELKGKGKGKFQEGGETTIHKDLLKPKAGAAMSAGEIFSLSSENLDL